MPRLRHLNLARNGGLTRHGTVGLITRMHEKYMNSGSQEPLALEKLNIQGTWLED